MRYDLTQKELQTAIEFYLNEKVLKLPVHIDKVEPQSYPSSNGKRTYVLHVYAHDDQEHLSDESVAKLASQ